MTDAIEATKTEPAGLINTATNILLSPGEAFTELQQRPSKLFPLALIVLSTMAVMFWYFSIVDFDWYIDDTLAAVNLDDEQLETAREQMASMSQTTFKMFGIFSGAIGILVVYVLQSGYLSLTSAISGSGQKFGDWFSLVLWTGLPYMLSVVGMVSTIALSPNGQLGSYDLDPLTLANLGMQSGNSSLTAIFNGISLPMLWGIALTIMGYRQWLDCSLLKAMTVVLAPYFLILGIWAYFALT
ncbi:MAG: YIP1 family protein [Gammaproteobacteria bacterium]|nr:YIP1 family protein [Gammaproteobacteria bacterium]